MTLLRLAALAAALILPAGLLSPAAAQEPAAAVAEAPLPAFPGALGWAAQTPGGRGGRIIRVTNLDAAGPGSCCASEPGSIIGSFWESLMCSVKNWALAHARFYSTGTR